MQNQRNKQTILEIYNNVLPALAERINQNIAPVVALFHDFGLERLVDTWTKDPSDQDEQVISIENGNVQYMGLKLRLEGFTRPGAGAFDLSKELIFRLDKEDYKVGPDKNSAWLEKEYTQRWSQEEYNEVAERWVESLIDDLTQQVEKITG